MVRRITTIGLAAVCVVAMTAPGAAAQKKTAAASAKAQTNAAGTVSMTGCLHADGSRLILTDLPDAQAPKGRNWKTGFITKNRKDMEVVAASSSLKLKEHVGHKITVVGKKDGDAHLNAQSLRHVARSCS